MLGDGLVDGESLGGSDRSVLVCPAPLGRRAQAVHSAICGLDDDLRQTIAFEVGDGG